MMLGETDPRDTKKPLEKALRKGKISRAFYDSKVKSLDEHIFQIQQREHEDTLKGPFRNNPAADIRKGHIVLKLTCPSCGTRGENTHGNIDFQILGKDQDGFLYFECPKCRKHLQYDPMTGNIKTRKGLLGFLFGIFR